jgi:hypothetical protein
VQGVTEEQWQLVSARLHADEGGGAYDSRALCRRHADKWLYRYCPPSCALCVHPVSAAGGSKLAPHWIRTETRAPKGSRVHLVPCYRDALARRKPIDSPVTAGGDSDQPTDTPMRRACPTEQRRYWLTGDLRDTRKGKNRTFP